MITNTRLPGLVGDVIVALIVVEPGAAARALYQVRRGLAFSVVQIQAIERRHDSETTFMVDAVATRRRANH